MEEYAVRITNEQLACEYNYYLVQKLLKKALSEKLITVDEFNKIIGIDKLKVVHLNDSKNPINAHKDRHENIGYGTLGFDNILKVVYHPKLTSIPKILETP